MTPKETICREFGVQRGVVNFGSSLNPTFGTEFVKLDGTVTVTFTSTVTVTFNLQLQLQLRLQLQLQLQLQLRLQLVLR